MEGSDWIFNVESVYLKLKKEIPIINMGVLGNYKYKFFSFSFSFKL